MTKLIIILFVITIFFFTEINCGLISWFESIGKPKWYSKIDKPPLIEIFEPNGLRVSIADTVGLNLVKFNVKLNDDPILLDETITQKSNGRWWYTNEDVELKIGDKLKYSIYVQVNDEELSFSQKTYKVKNLIPMPSSLSFSSDPLPSNNINNSPLEKLCPCSNVTEEINEHIKLTKNEFTEINRAIIQQNFELESLYKIIHENMKNNTKLLFIDNNGGPLNNTKMSEIKLIIEEQLDLKDLHEIFIHDRTPCGILLDVFSAVEKMKILIAANSKNLKNTKQQFFEPTESDCLYENNYFIHKIHY